MTLKEAFDRIKDWVYSRIPVYSSEDPETWVGFVMSRDILAGVAHDQFDMTLAEITKPLYFVSENLPGHVLLKSFRARTHLFGVMDDFGDLTGIITLEDVLEALIGEEIVDEVDTVADMQEVARRRKREQFAEQEVPQIGTSKPKSNAWVRPKTARRCRRQTVRRMARLIELLKLRQFIPRVLCSPTRQQGTYPARNRG